MKPQHRPVEFLRAACVALVVSLGFAAGCAQAQSGPIEDLAAFPQDKLEISEGKKVKYTFQVWLADSPRRQSQGLMFVRDLPDLRGMLFVHDQPKDISMWMKNTYIALDMVFIDSDNRIQQIHENAVPHSLDLIRSDKPARAVLEIAGGEARRLGLHAGQLVTHPALVSH
ncbi:MAG TPA: DUF192 domain-containing protein [Steroidobacteraceae bacterium]|nr:DUF192 domain-containing protein [Steroidobacteraceae bacterium]